MQPISKGRAYLFAHFLPMLGLGAALAVEVYVSAISHSAKTFGPLTITVWSPVIWFAATILNVWVVFPGWKKSGTAFLAGIIVPAIVAVFCGVTLLTD